MSNKSAVLQGRGIRGTRAWKLAEYFGFPRACFEARLTLGVSFSRLGNGTYTKKDLDAIEQYMKEVKSIEEKLTDFHKNLDENEALLSDGK